MCSQASTTLRNTAVHCDIQHIQFSTSCFNPASKLLRIFIPSSLQGRMQAKLWIICFLRWRLGSALPHSYSPDLSNCDYNLRWRNRFMGLAYTQFWQPTALFALGVPMALGPFINYVRVSDGGGVGKISTYSYFGEEGQTHSYVMFSKSIFYIRNRVVKWFGRDHISFV